MFAPDRSKVTNINPLTILIVVPSLQAGAADLGVIDLVRILAAAGNRAIVLSNGGRLESEIATLGGEFIRADVASKNPFVMMRNAGLMRQIVRREKCDIVHAHGRAPAWSAWIVSRLTGIPFVTSWYKGFREQNIFKRLYNSVMARGDRIIAVSDQLAELISHRYGISWGRINVVPLAVDLQRFDPQNVSHERVDTIRRSFGIDPETKLILVTGRL